MAAIGRILWKIKQLYKQRCSQAHPPMSANALVARAALLATVAIVGVSVLAAVVVLGTEIVGGPSGGSSRGIWRQDMSALATLAIWQAIAVVLTVLASVLLAGAAGTCWPCGRPPARRASISRPCC